MAVFLCGFMGCGKSTAADLLAKNMGCSCCDTDELIVKREGMSIPEIFDKKGEAYFRNADKELLRELSGKKGVVACGGGTMLSAENAAVAREKGVVVFINTPFDTCYERIKDDKNRPIAASRTREQLRELYEQRAEKYTAHSDHVIDGSGTPFAIAGKIYDIVKRMAAK